MAYDEYITGLHDDNSPINRKEYSDDLEIDYVAENECLKNRLIASESRSRYQASLLKEAGGIFELYRMTNSITEKELNRLNEIFEPYLTN